MDYKKNNKTVGIIGGMGPAATIDLMQRIIKLTPANDDIDHVHCLVDNNPKVPSRIKALIEGNGEDPEPFLIKMALGLEQSGADFLAIACNTAHHYHQAISQAVEIPVINIIDVVLTHLQKHHANCLRVGILGSPAIQITKIYEAKFAKAGFTVIYPDQEHQAALFELIKAVKSGAKSKQLQAIYARICEQFIDRQLDITITACTELSALNITSSVATVDAADILAQEIVDTANR